MTRAASSVRALGTLSAVLLSLGMLAACTPAPVPEPEPTETALFASDEEAYEAAEETYRAYTDALNDVDTSEPASFEPILDYTSGDFGARERENLSTMHAEGFVLSGTAAIQDFDGREVSADRSEVTARICIDVSGVDVTDADGQSIVSPDRPDVQSAVVTFIASGGRLTIAHATDEDPSTCES